MLIMRMKGVGAAALAAAFLSAGPALAADWFRDFNDGTTKDAGGAELMNQPLPGVPPGEWSTAVVDFPSGSDKSFRMMFAGGGSDGDSGVMLDHNDIFVGNVSARMLIRYSQNPLLVQTPTNSEINAGFILHVQPDFQSYICVLDDRGYLQLQEVRPGLSIQGFPGGSKTLEEAGVPFSPDKDWWIRFEVLPIPPEGVFLRARAWEDGTPEPMCTWIVEAFDTEDILMGGATAIVANEDENVPDGQNFIDVDNVSVSSTITCVEICANGLDDDEDGAADCADLDCDLHGSCACPVPFADYDDDDDVDADDFAEFQRCFTGADDLAQVFDAARCDCFDREEVSGDGVFGRLSDGDDDVDAADLEVFLRCVSGPEVPAHPNCEGPR